MANVKISINDKTYAIDCGEGQEQRVAELANFINERVRMVKQGSGAVANDQLFVITSLMIADELFELQEGGAQPAQPANTAGLIEEAKVAAIIDEVGKRINSLKQEVEAL